MKHYHGYHVFINTVSKYLKPNWEWNWKSNSEYTE